MKFLVDNALSPLVAEYLRKNGYDAVHVRDYGMQQSADYDIFSRALRENRIIVSADTDFGSLTHSLKNKIPSLILFRHGTEHRPEKQITLLLYNLPALRDVLEQGCIVVFDKTRIRVRQ